MLTQDGLAECDQPGKIPWNTPPRLGIEQGDREDRQWDSFILPLSYHDWLYDKDYRNDTRQSFGCALYNKEEAITSELLVKMF